MSPKKIPNKQELKVWGLLKDRNDYEFFHRITKMLSAAILRTYSSLQSGQLPNLPGPFRITLLRKHTST